MHDHFKGQFFHLTFHPFLQSLLRPSRWRLTSLLLRLLEPSSPATWSAPWASTWPGWGGVTTPAWTLELRSCQTCPCKWTVWPRATQGSPNVSLPMKEDWQQTESTSMFKVRQTYQWLCIQITSYIEITKKNDVNGLMDGSCGYKEWNDK